MPQLPFAWPPFYQSINLNNISFPFAAKEQSPSSWNLEPTQWSDPRIAANGWLIYPMPWTGVPLTFSGPVDIRSNPAVGSYFASIKDGQLWVQLARNTNAIIVKGGAASGETYKFRVRSAVLGGGGGTSFYAFGLVATGLALETGAINYFRIGAFDVNMQMHWFTGGTFHPTLPNGDAPVISTVGDADATYYIDVPLPAGPVQDVASRGVSPFSGAWGAYYAGGGNVDLAAPVTHAGVFIGSQNLVRPNLFYIDFVRRLPLYSFP